MHTFMYLSMTIAHIERSVSLEKSWLALLLAAAAGCGWLLLAAAAVLWLLLAAAGYCCLLVAGCWLLPVLKLASEGDSCVCIYTYT